MRSPASFFDATRRPLHVTASGHFLPQSFLSPDMPFFGNFDVYQALFAMKRIASFQ